MPSALQLSAGMAYRTVGARLQAISLDGPFFAASLDPSATNEKRPRRIIYGAGARARRSASVRLAFGNKSENKSVLAIDRDRRRRFHRFDHIAVFARSRNPPQVDAYDCAARPRRRSVV